MVQELAEVVQMLEDGTPLERIEGFIFDTRLDDEQRSVLWLIAWGATIDATFGASMVARELGRPWSTG